MKIAVCDDEKIFIEQVNEYVIKAVEKHDRKCSVQVFQSGEELVNAFEREYFDAIFLDIDMPHINGFEAAKRLMKINSNVTLIFVSCKEALVYSSYEYKPFWFVPKSQLSLLEKVMEKLLQKIENEETDKRLVTLQITKNSLCHINLSETAYIKSEGHYINVYDINGKVTASFRNNLNNLEKQLLEYNFLRCHERILVNCRMINCIGSSDCILSNGTEVPVSRRKMTETKKLFQQYLREVM